MGAARRGTVGGRAEHSAASRWVPVVRQSRWRRRHGFSEGWRRRGLPAAASARRWIVSGCARVWTI
jgi:hypothetical protein